MQRVSDAWKAAHKQDIVPEQFIEIEYSVTDPDVQGDASASSNGEVEFAVTEDIVDSANKNPPLYATLEHNIFALDGSMDIIPDAPQYGDTGYISSYMSGEDGTFAEVPLVSIDFSKVHTPVVPGMSIMWSEEYGEYADTFRVTAWNGTASVDTYLIEGNRDSRSLLEIDMAGYNKITIEILKWSKPYHRARISYIMIGLKQIYTKDDLMSYKHEQSVDLLSGALPKASITFSLDNSDDRWNPDNPQGAEKYLLERQPLVVKYGMRIGETIEWIKAGTFYMSEWSTPMNGLEATFTARDVVDRMHEVYAGAKSGTLYSIALAGLEQAGIPLTSEGSVQYHLDDSLKSITTDFSAEQQEYSVAEVLQMVANAGCCVMYQDRNGIFRIEPASTEVTDYEVSADVSFSHPEYTISKELKAVSVNNGMGYAENNPVGEVQTIDNPLINTAVNAQRVAEWIRDAIKDRKTISGEFRADVRLDALDKISVNSKYADQTVRITNITYDLTGGFKGTYTGRVV